MASPDRSDRIEGFVRVWDPLEANHSTDRVLAAVVLQQMDRTAEDFLRNEKAETNEGNGSAAVVIVGLPR